jgi:CBS domain-containing protein/PAS domain-containing protein
MINAPLHIPKNISVTSAISMMIKRGKGSVLVVEDSSQDEEIFLQSFQKPEKFSASALLGIFTQSDVVTLAATGRLHDENLTIAEVMKSPVILLDLSELVPEGSNLSPDLSKGLQSLSDSVQQSFISQALFLYEAHKINHLPIVDPGKNIIGVMTYENLMKSLIGVENDSLKNIVNIQSPGETIQKNEGKNFLTCPPLEGTIRHRGSAIGVRGDRQASDDKPDGTNIQPDLKSLAIKSLGNVETRRLIADENCLLLVIDRQGIILRAEGENLVNGCPNQNLVGSNLFDLNLQDLAVRQQLYQILQTGKNTQDLEGLSDLFLSENDDGKIYKFKYVPFTNSQDEFVGVLCVVTDITKEQKTEAELRSLFRAMTDLVLVLDREGRYLSIAPTKTNLLYKPPREVLGKTLSEYFPQKQQQCFSVKFMRL